MIFFMAYIIIPATTITHGETTEEGVTTEGNITKTTATILDNTVRRQD